MDFKFTKIPDYLILDNRNKLKEEDYEIFAKKDKEFPKKEEEIKPRDIYTTPFNFAKFEDLKNNTKSFVFAGS